MHFFLFLRAIVIAIPADTVLLTRTLQTDDKKVSVIAFFAFSQPGVYFP